MGRLLLLSCSEAKVGGVDPLPAIERYDGPVFRVVRKFLREAPAPLRDVEIYILSAKYGLILAAKEIEDYDERMTPARAVELREATLAELQQAVARSQPSQLFLSLGRDYLHAIEGYEEQLPPGIQVLVSNGPTGKKLTALKAWLYDQKALPVPQRREGRVQQPGLSLTTPRSVQIRGRMIVRSTQEALDQALQALAEGHGDPDRYYAWYALVDGRKVSPKWWVSQLTDLPVSAFVADEARRVLRALGIEVYQTDG